MDGHERDTSEPKSRGWVALACLLPLRVGVLKRKHATVAGHSP
jgi:hypothetical protein